MCSNGQMTKRIIVWKKGKKGQNVDEYDFVECGTLGDGVTMGKLYKKGDASKRDCFQGQSVVLKQKKSFKYDGTMKGAQEVVENLVKERKSDIYLEHLLHLHLLVKEPKNIAKLVFSSKSQFAFILREKTLVPVKISYFYEEERNKDRGAGKAAEQGRNDVEQRIANELKAYYSPKDARALDEDWKNKRNRLFSNGSFIYHDFDTSI